MKRVLLMFLFACGAKSAPASEPGPAKPPATANDCVKTGCSGTVCAEPGNEAVTTCEFRPEYACYRDAACERQADGKCGWTQTPALTACLASAPAGATGDTPQ